MIFEHLVRQSTNHINNNQDFIAHIKNTTLGRRECITCYGVRNLFTYVPGGPAIEMIRHRLDQDTALQYNIHLIGFYLQNTFILFQLHLYEEKEGKVMGYPVSLTVANLYMEAFESRVLRNTEKPP